MPRQDWFLSESLNAQPTQLSHEIQAVLSNNISLASNGHINGHTNGQINGSANGVAHEESGIVHVDQVKTREGEAT